FDERRASIIADREALAERDKRYQEARTFLLRNPLDPTMSQRRRELNDSVIQLSQERSKYRERLAHNMMDIKSARADIENRRFIEQSEFRLNEIIENAERGIGQLHAMLAELDEKIGAAQAELDSINKALLSAV